MGTLIGTTEAAEICGVERSTFFRWAQLGRVPVAQRLAGPNGALLFDREVVEAHAKARKSEDPAT